jgi:ferric-dicitrate binding protein FerR (iron transport regulator)
MDAAKTSVAGNGAVEIGLMDDEVDDAVRRTFHTWATTIKPPAAAWEQVRRCIEDTTSLSHSRQEHEAIASAYKEMKRWTKH